jgi:hypothetical protein
MSKKKSNKILRRGSRPIPRDLMTVSRPRPWYTNDSIKNMRFSWRYQEHESLRRYQDNGILVTASRSRPWDSHDGTKTMKFSWGYQDHKNLVTVPRPWESHDGTKTMGFLLPHQDQGHEILMMAQRPWDSRNRIKTSAFRFSIRYQQQRRVVL